MSDTTTRSGGVLSRAALTTVGMAVQGLARFLYTLAIGRLAGPEALGDTNSLLSIAIYLSLVLPAGLGVGASRYLPGLASAGAAVSLLKRWFWVSSLVLALVAVPAAFLITTDLIASLSCAVLVFAYNAYVFTRGALMGEDRILRATLADCVSSVIAITALVAVLILDMHWALLFPLALGYALFAVAGWPRTPNQPVSPTMRKTILRFVRDATIGGLATGGLLPATMIFVKAYDSPVQAGLFAAALSLATPASLVSQAVNQVLIPHFARLKSTPSTARSSHLKIFAATTALFTAVFGALILLAPWILSFLYGSRYEGGSAAMQALLVVVFLISATCAPSAFLVSNGKQKTFAAIWLLAFILGSTTMIVASPLLGMWGALLGFAVGGGGGSLAIISSGLMLKPVAPSSDESQEN